MRIKTLFMMHVFSPVQFTSTVIVLFAFTSIMQGQQRQAAPIRSSLALPTSCLAGTQDQAADIVVVAGVVYICSSTNKWSAVGPVDRIENVWTKSQHFAGPVPFVDVTAMGARLWAADNSPAGNWAQCNGNSATVNLTSTNGGYTFTSGDGIVIYGCGATNKMKTPAAPVVTPATAAGETGTGWYCTIPTNMVGESRYKYSIIARDLYGGLTAAGPVTTITTGQPRLGMATATIKTISRTNDTINVTTTANNLLNTGNPSSCGTLIHLVLSAGPMSLNGWYTVGQVTNANAFALLNTATDSRALGWTWGDNNIASGVAGKVTYYVSNHIHITPVTGAWQYYVCAQRPGDENYHLIGSTKPQGYANGYQDIDFDDYDSPFMDKQKYPRYVETAEEEKTNTNDRICTSDKATNDMYVGIVTAGGGSKTLTVSPNTVQRIGPNQFTAVDDAPIFLAAARAADYELNDYSAFSYVYAPGAANPPRHNSLFYNFYSPLVLPTKTTVVQTGNIYTEEPIIIRGSTTWDGGSSSGTGAMQFGWQNHPSVSTTLGGPVFDVTGPNNTFNNLQISSTAANGAVLVVHDSADFTTWDHVNFSSSSSSTDYLSMAYIARNTSGTISPVYMHQVAFSSGPDQVNDKSWTPLFWLAPGQNGSGGINTGAIYLVMQDVSWNRRGIYASGNNGSNGLGQLDINWSYQQGGLTPFLAIQNSPIGGPAELHNISVDTEAQPLVACLNASSLCGSFDLNVSPQEGVASALFSGVRPALAHVSFWGQAGSTQLYKLPNRNASYEGSVYGLFSPFDTSGSYLPSYYSSLQTFNEPVHIPNGSSFYFDLLPPSNVTARVNSGGGVPVGTYYYVVTAVGMDSGETIASQPSDAVAISRGSQTVNLAWTNPVGSVSSNVYRCGRTPAQCLTGGMAYPLANSWFRVALHVAGTSYSDASANSKQIVLPMVSGSGASGGNNQMLWAPEFIASPNGAVPSGCSLTLPTAGSFKSGASGTCTVTITFANAAPNGWSCSAHDVTTPANQVNETGYTTTTCIISGKTDKNDVIVWTATGF